MSAIILYHRRLDCLLNPLFRRKSMKTSKLRDNVLCEGNPPVTGGFPHKGPVTRKMFPSHDVIMAGTVVGSPTFTGSTLEGLTYWGRVTHICVSKLTIIRSDNGMMPSHYMNQCCIIVNWTLRNKLQWNLNRNSYIFIRLEMAAICLGLSVFNLNKRPVGL